MISDGLVIVNPQILSAFVRSFSAFADCFNNLVARCTNCLGSTEPCSDCTIALAAIKTLAVHVEAMVPPRLPLNLERGN